MSSPAAKKAKLLSDASACSTGIREPTRDGAASGAAKGVAIASVRPASPGPVSITQLLELQSGQRLSMEEHLSTWAAQMKAYVDFEIIAFLKTHQANSIRFAMHHQHVNGSRAWEAEVLVRVIPQSIESFSRDL